MDILLNEELEQWLDENQAFTVSRHFSTESIQRALALAEEGYEIELQDGIEEQLDHYYLMLTLYEDDEIQDQIVIGVTLLEEDES